MMHGRGKSDSAILAAKPANKADPPAAEQSVVETAAAEPVEQRVGTKGNANQQARTGRRAGRACPKRWNAYGKSRGKGRRRGSPRSSTTSASIYLARRSSNSRKTPRRESMD